MHRLAPEVECVRLTLLTSLAVYIFFWSPLCSLLFVCAIAIVPSLLYPSLLVMEVTGRERMEKMHLALGLVALVRGSFFVVFQNAFGELSKKGYP